jgi:hypothetical protein
VSAFEIPASALPRCIGCNAPLDPDLPIVLREVTGWCRPRSAGGQNHVIARVETGRYLCGACGQTLQRTGQLRQGALL